MLKVTSEPAMEGKKMDKINFIHTEVGTDIVVSLSFDDGTEFGVDGFTIIRTPKYEFALFPHEKGACVNWDEKTDAREIIREITCAGHVVTFVSNLKSYQFDASRLSADKINALWRTIDKMNFDGSIKINRNS
jgi:hypothetical protein